MATTKTFPHFVALPEDIRRDIWARAVDKILDPPAVNIVDISSRYADEIYEHILTTEARRNAIQIAQAEADPNWSAIATATHQSRVVTQEVDSAIRNYRTTLLQIAPRLGNRRPVAFPPFWTLSEVAITCTGAYKTFRQRLGKVGDQRRNRDDSAPFDPTRDIVCLEGPGRRYWNPERPLFANIGASTVFPDEQVVAMGTRPWETGALPVQEYTKCPSLRGISPAIASLRRIAFLYEPINCSPDSFRLRLGLDALFPHNLPELREIYLIDRSIKLRAPITDPRKQLALVPRFAGYNHSTFYEVRVNKTAENLWVIRGYGGQLLPVFECAAAVRFHYDFVHRNSDHDGPKIAVKVLTSIQHTMEF